MKYGVIRARTSERKIVRAYFKAVKQGILCVGRKKNIRLLNQLIR
jgi:hypothetical protein